MIELLRAGRELGKTLEVGTGCGYQAAVLSHVATEVYSVGLLLSTQSNKSRCQHLRLQRSPEHADGSVGLKEAAPFDTIIPVRRRARCRRPSPSRWPKATRLILPGGRPARAWCSSSARPAASETRLSAVRFVPLLPGAR